jgi:hypothetical protein
MLSDQVIVVAATINSKTLMRHIGVGVPKRFRTILILNAAEVQDGPELRASSTGAEFHVP